MILTFFLLAFTILGCTNDNVASSIEVINLEPGLNNPTQIFLSQYTTDVTYVSLEMNDGFPLQGVYSFDSHDTVMLVRDPQGFFLYNSNGEFLSRIGRTGRGPEEYTYGLNGKIGPQKSIYINDGKGLVEYNLNGDYLSRYPLFSNPEIFKWATTSWIMVNDSLVLVHVRNNSGKEEYKGMILDKTGKIVHRYRNHNIYEGRTMTNSSFARFYTQNGQIAFLESFNDTVFRLDMNLEQIPTYLFQWGKFYISPNEYWNRFALKTLRDRQWAWAYDIFETRDFILLDLVCCLPMLKRTVPVSIPGVLPTEFTSRVLGVYDKNTKGLVISEISRTDEKLQITGLFNDIDGGPKFYPKFRMGEDRFVMPVEAYDLKRYVESESFRNSHAKFPEKKKVLEELVNSLKEDSNPVLMVVTMK